MEVPEAALPAPADVETAEGVRVKVLVGLVWPVWHRVPVRTRRRVYRWTGAKSRPTWRDGDRVIVLWHRSRLMAELAARSNREEFGHPAHVEVADGRVGCVVDLRPAIARLEGEG